MPSIVGPVQIIHVSGGVVQFGDTVYISPKNSSKVVEGSGSGNNGGLIVNNNGLNGNNILDQNLIDQPTVGNN
ncbi:spore germination protein [Cytobacillus sp. Hz8]|uniref:spore germination protein n=1 Tax=Cytobacillus sp. Hz8 TaxID=3347168 RepID=UPI0035DC5D93